jgi:hypothetical protein
MPNQCRALSVFAVYPLPAKLPILHCTLPTLTPACLSRSTTSAVQRSTAPASRDRRRRRRNLQGEEHDCMHQPRQFQSGSLSLFLFFASSRRSPGGCTLGGVGGRSAPAGPEAAPQTFAKIQECVRTYVVAAPRDCQQAWAPRGCAHTRGMMKT